MKRLILLILVLAPFALWEMARSEHRARSASMFRPRIGRFHTPDAARAEPPRQMEIVGYPKATPEHAVKEARRKLDATLSDWLAKAGLPRGWKPPRPLVESVVRFQPIQETVKDYGTVYIQPVTLELSDAHRDAFIAAYERETAGRRLVLLAEVLVFVLICLGVIAGYIRADEATRGYYTNYLRVAAVAGVGAAAPRLSIFLPEFKKRRKEPETMTKPRILDILADDFDRAWFWFEGLPGWRKVLAVAGAVLLVGLLLHVAALVLALLLIASVVFLVLAWFEEILWLMRQSDDVFPGRHDKLIWAAMLVLLPPLGVIALWAFRRSLKAEKCAKPTPEPASWRDWI